MQLLSIKGLAMSALLSLAASQPALAVTYDFRYQFINPPQSNYAGPYLVTGSFDGVDDGLFVTDISNVSAALDGVSFVGPLQVARYADIFRPAVSFVLANNSFSIFSPGGDAPDVFILSASTAANSIATAYTNFYSASSRYRYVQEYLAPGAIPTGDWSLTVRPPVPEPGTYALFALGLAGIGVAARRRRED